MDEGQAIGLRASSPDLQAIANLVQQAAHLRQGNSLELLALLRLLEFMHQGIRDGMFQTSLPDNRQALYSLLKDIEAGGGWPYISRMRLQEFLVHLTPDEMPAPSHEREH